MLNRIIPTLSVTGESVPVLFPRLWLYATPRLVARRCLRVYTHET